MRKGVVRGRDRYEWGSRGRGKKESEEESDVDSRTSLHNMKLKTKKGISLGIEVK